MVAAGCGWLQVVAAGYLFYKHPLKTHAVDKQTYFTVQGMVIVGCETPNQLTFGLVKDDAVILDATGWFPVKIWKEQIEEVKSRHCYTIACIKKKHQSAVTTTPQTQVVPIQLNISVPDVQFFENQKRINVSKVLSVGEIVQTKGCSTCKHPIKEWVGLEFVTCENCKDSVLPDNLTTQL